MLTTWICGPMRCWIREKNSVFRQNLMQNVSIHQIGKQVENLGYQIYERLIVFTTPLVHHYTNNLEYQKKKRRNHELSLNKKATWIILVSQCWHCSIRNECKNLHYFYYLNMPYFKNRLSAFVIQTLLWAQNERSMDISFCPQYIFMP